MSDPPLPASSDRGRSTTNRRRSHSGSSRRQLTRQPTQSYLLYPALTPPEGIQVPSGAATYSPPLYQSPPAATYDPRSYARQYTMSTHPQITIASPPSPFPYSPGFTHPPAPQHGLVPQGLHPSYQPILQSHTHTYQYALHTSEGVFRSLFSLSCCFLIILQPTVHHRFLLIRHLFCHTLLPAAHSSLQLH
jgi:hypothetical protein